MSRKQKSDVAAASAAVLFNQLSEWRSLPDGELYDRLRCHLEGTLTAYDDAEPVFPPTLGELTMPDEIKPALRAAVAAHARRLLDIIGEYAESPQVVLEAAIKDGLEDMLYDLLPPLLRGKTWT